MKKRERRERYIRREERGEGRERYIYRETQSAKIASEHLRNQTGSKYTGLTANSSSWDCGEEVGKTVMMYKPY